MRKNSKPSTTEYELLTLVISERAGREIAKLYESRLGKPLSYGTLYPTLSRMADQGWIKSRDARTVDRRVRYFKMTASGARVLEDARAEYGRLAGLPEGAQ